MAEVGTAFVSLMPSAKGFGSATEKQIGGEMDSSGKKLGSKFGAAMKVGAAAVVGGALIAGKFLSDSIAEAREAQKVAALTESTIKATGSAANVTAKQVADLAESISLKTGIDDETIQSGENMLLTFKNIRNEVGKGNDIFDQSTETLIDMSAAMGTEPKQAAIQLGKALNDPIKGISALSRVGVTFTEGQKKVIEGLVETGDTAAAQKVILKELNSEFGGAAEAQATAGDKMAVAWGNLKEAAGNAILPVIDKMLPKLTGAVSGLTDAIRTGEWSEAWDAARRATEKGLREVQAGVRKFVSERLIPAIQVGLGKAREAWADKWENFWKDPEKAYDKTIHRTEFFGDDLTGTALNVAKDAAFAFIRAFQATPRGAVRIAGQTLTQVRQALAGLPGLVSHIAIDVSGSFFRGVASMPDRARGLAINVSLELMSGFRNAISGATAIGAAIVNGMIGGIEDAAVGVATAAARVVTDAIQSAKDAAHISSPSKKMHEVGQQMVEGLALGIEGGHGRVSSSMDRLAAGMVLNRPSFAGVTGPGSAHGSRGGNVFHLYDADGTLMGTMRGVVKGDRDNTAMRRRAGAAG